MIIGITIAGPTLENRTGREADLHQSRDERLDRAETGRLAGFGALTLAGMFISRLS
jgi:hypothetical protein